jgi:hypothetical protein
MGQPALDDKCRGRACPARGARVLVQLMVGRRKRLPHNQCPAAILLVGARESALLKFDQLKP